MRGEFTGKPLSHLSNLGFIRGSLLQCLAQPLSSGSEPRIHIILVLYIVNLLLDLMQHFVILLLFWLKMVAPRLVLVVCRSIKSGFRLLCIQIFLRGSHCFLNYDLQESLLIYTLVEAYVFLCHSRRIIEALTLYLFYVMTCYKYNNKIFSKLQTNITFLSYCYITYATLLFSHFIGPVSVKD